MKFTELEDSVIRHDYQEIKIQESTQVLGVGAIPRSIPVILKDDLVDIVKAGGNKSWEALFFHFSLNLLSGITMSKKIPSITNIQLYH